MLAIVGPVLTSIGVLAYIFGFHKSLWDCRYWAIWWYFASTWTVWWDLLKRAWKYVKVEP